MIILLKNNQFSITMFYSLKIIIVFLSCLYIYKSSFNSDIKSISPNKFHGKINPKHCNHFYEYSIIEKPPTEKEDGRKTNLCKYCRNKYFETIPKLNRDNYKVEILSSNCENGNGVKYSSELPFLNIFIYVKFCF